jgi:hypothetical protein
MTSRLVICCPVCPLNIINNCGGRVFHIRTSSSIHVRITECCTPNWPWKTAGAPLFRFVFRFAGLKPWSELYGKTSILVRIAGCWYYSYILLSSRNPKTNWCLSRSYGIRFGEKRLRLEHMQTVNWTSRRIGFNSAWSGSGLWSFFKIFKSENKKLKTYSGWCPFKGLSSGTTLMQIQSGRTIPLIWLTKVGSDCVWFEAQ